MAGISEGHRFWPTTPRPIAINRALSGYRDIVYVVTRQESMTKISSLYVCMRIVRELLYGVKNVFVGTKLECGTAGELDLDIAFQVNCAATISPGWYHDDAAMQLSGCVNRSLQGAGVIGSAVSFCAIVAHVMVHGRI